jgi:hypothetical protein
MGIIDNVGYAVKFLVECFRMILEDPRLLVPSLLSVVIGFFVSLVVVVPFIFMGLLGKIGFPAFGGIALTALFVSYALTYFFTGATSYAVYQHVRFGKSSLGEAFERALANVATLLLLAVTAALIQMLVNMLKGTSNNRRGAGIVVGLIASLAADVIKEGWTIAVSLLVPVAVIAQLGYVDTLKRAFDIVRQNLVIVGAGEVAIRLLVGFIGFVGAAFFIVSAIGLFFLLSPLSPVLALAVAVIAFFVGTSIVATLTQFIRTAYYTQVYIWAEDATVHGPAGSTAPPQAIKNAFSI